MGCPPTTYQGITRDRLASLQQAASQQLGLVISGDIGSATDPGGKNSVSWIYNEVNQTLTLEVMQTTYPCFLVKQLMNSFVASCS